MCFKHFEAHRHTQAHTSTALRVPTRAQAESRRVEGVLYGEYWAALERAGFGAAEVALEACLGLELLSGLGQRDERAEGGPGGGGGVEHSVRAWVIHRRGE